MRRALGLSLLVVAAGCAGQAPAPAPLRTTSAAATTAPGVAPKAAPVVRNGMHALPLGSVARPFAAYLNAMHDRIHPEFSDKVLPELDARPADDPSNDENLATRVAIVSSAEDGRIVSLEIVKSSGVAAFDQAALDSVQRAQPFGPAPGAIKSADGNVHVDWEFRRKDIFACSTMHARPFLFGP